MIDRAGDRNPPDQAPLGSDDPADDPARSPTTVPGHNPSDRTPLEFCDTVSGRLLVVFDAAVWPDRRAVAVSTVDGRSWVCRGRPEPIGAALVTNGDFGGGIEHWSLETSTPGVDLGVDFAEEWTLGGMHTAYVSDVSVSSETAVLAYAGDDPASVLPIVGGRPYEVTGLIGTHRCAAELRFDILSADGRVLSTISEHVAAGVRGGQHRADYHLVRRSLTAPTGADHARLRIHKGPTIENERDSYLFVAEVQVNRPGRRLAAAILDPARSTALARWHTPTILSVPLPRSVLDGRTHVLRVHDPGSARSLDGSPVTSRVHRTFDGALEQVSGPVVTGWLRDRADPAASTVVCLEIDGIEVATQEAEPDEDLPGYRFSFMVPSQHLDGLAHDLVVRSVPDGSVVAEGPRILSATVPGGSARAPDPEIARLQARIASLSQALATSEQARRRLTRQAADAETLHGQAASAEQPPPKPASVPRQAPVTLATGTLSNGRPRAAVVAWDVGHNPVGRAVVLHELLRADWDVDLIGPSWERYGHGLWPPLRSLPISLVSWPCRDLGDFVAPAFLHAGRERYDLVVVSKPRLPSMLVGLLIKEHSECPLIVDVDDEELSFVGGGEPTDLDALETAGPEALAEPYGAAATRYAVSLVRHADAISVSNVALRRRYGGHLVRHARDEQLFRMSQTARAASRAELGIADGEFALLFLGTAREHKGILLIAEALQEMDDAGFSLHVIGGSADEPLHSRLAALDRAHIRLHGERRLDEVPRILAAADAVPLLQDPGHPISAFQFPAKLADAAALGRPILVTDVPPLADLLPTEGLHVVRDKATIISTLRELADGHGQASSGRLRELFLSEFSLAVNRARLRLAIQAAGEDRKPLPDEQPRLEEVVLRGFGEAARRRQAALPPTAHRPGRDRWRRSTPSRRPDVAVFWKQHDTGIFGRRAEMLTRYLVETGHVGRALYFDAPLARTTLESFLSVLQDDPSGQEGPMVRNTFARWLGLLDDDLVRQRVFIHGGTRGPEPDSLVQPAAAEYSAFVSEQLQDAGLDPARTMALVFPVVWDFARVRDAVPFARVIVDLVDDEREFRSRPEYRDRLTSLYEQTILAADLVTANCEPLADRFAYLGTSIHVVPNGAEPFPAEVPPIPPILARLPHPLIGYVGDMRDRIDWDLVRRLVRQRPGWSFVFAGPPGDAAAVGDLRRSPNVVFAGVIEYVDLPAYLRHLDAAIVPHLRSPLTDSMNPLKVYNYVAAGLPVVATAVPNLQDIEASVCYADTAEGFIDALEDALAGRPTRAAPERPAVGLSRYGWKARAEQMGALMDTLFQ